MPGSQEAQVLREELTRWTAAGLIDAEQAGQIEAAEAARLKVTAAPRNRLPLAVEALGYLGTVIALTAAALAIRQFWKDIPPAAELAFNAVAAAGLITAGAALRTSSDPAFARLRGALWLIATACTAGFAWVLTHSYLHLPLRDVAVIAAAAGLACAIPLWWHSRSALMHLALFGSTAALVGTGIDWFISNSQPWQFGLAFWALSALWGVAAYRGYLVPSTAGVVLACTGLLVGAAMTMDMAAGQVLAMGTVIFLLSAGVALRRVLLMGFGAAGTVWVVPETVHRYLPGSVFGPLAVTVVGLVLLGVAVWLARTHRRA